MNAQQMIVDTIATNLANMNTAGFKRTQVDFRDLMYVKLKEAGRDTTSNVMAPSGFEIGSGVSPGSTMKVYSQGTLQNTSGQLDMAIQGDGFFQVTTPDGVRYTRDGSFRTNATGQLVTSAGYTMQPSITIPTDSRAVSIGTDGTVTAFTGANTTGTTVGTINIVRFANPSGLTNQGDNLLAETPASGTAITGTAGQNGMGSIQQGFLEQSNVDMITELVSLITAQRAYETNSRAISAGDQMLQTTNRLAGG
jgi:flagellar basal-body rod protein FlgG